MGHTKVFVGNLSFKTTDHDLAAEFSSAGKVVSANIITRGPRSLGYGFVELESEEDAQKAVTLMNKKPIDGREINVELAKPRDESKNNEPRPRQQRRRTRGGGGPRGRGGYGMRRKYRSMRGDSNGGRRGRGGPNRSSRPPTNRTPSTTTLFVANLPFSVDDEALTKVFKDHNVTKAHVVKNKTGRSKGFGFVEFAAEADQQKALKDFEKHLLEGRELIVKVALTGNKRENGDQDKPSENKEGDKKEGEEKKEEKKE